MDGKRERDGGERRGWNERDCDAREALEKLKKKHSKERKKCKRRERKHKQKVNQSSIELIEWRN